MIETQFRLSGLALGALTLALGAATLAGWTFEIAWLEAPWAGAAAMRANTAAALALSGVALCWESRGTAPSRWRGAARLCAAVSALTALLTLGEDALGVDLGIDQLLAEAPERALAAPGRMAPNTAVCLTMIGTVLALGQPRARWLRWMADAMVPFVLVVAFVALAGYAYSATALYGVFGFESMALSTSIGLAALSLGTLLCRVEHPLTRLLVARNLAGAALRRSLPLLLLVPFAIGWLRLQGQRAGWYGTEFGLGLVVAASTVVLCAVSLWNAQLQGEAEATLERARRDQAFSLRLSDLLRAATTPDQVVFETARAVAEYLSLQRALFIEVDAAGGRVVWCRDYHCSGLQPLSGETTLSAFDPSAQALARAGHNIVSSDTSADPLTAERYANTYRPLGIRARVVVPLFRDGRWTGGLLVASDQPRHWQQRELDLIELAAQRAWEWTERLRAHEQLRMSIEESPLGKLTVDRHGQILQVNRRAEALFGYTRNELIGRSVDMLVPAESRTRHAELRHGFMAAPESRPMQAGRRLRVVRRDGSEIPVEITLTPLPTSGGAAVLISIADETRRVRAEEARERLFEELRLLNADLEQRVQARTEDLMRALSEREVLLQEIHHRVKNNLQVVSSLLKMQARRLADGAGRAALQDCDERVATIALIHETLYQAADYGKVPLADYFRSLIANVFRAHSGAERVRLETAIDALTLTIDKAIPCGLILNELITNALKHAFPDGRGGRIRVELHESAESMLRLLVCDDGVGMPPEGSMSTKSLGMQLVRALAEQLNATLTIDRDGGTTVRLEFSTRA